MSYAHINNAEEFRPPNYTASQSDLYLAFADTANAIEPVVSLADDST